MESLEFFFGAGLGGLIELSNGANRGSGSGVSFDRPCLPNRGDLGSPIGEDAAECIIGRGDLGSPIGEEAAEYIIGDEAVEYTIGDAVDAVVAGVANGSNPINEWERP